MLFRTILTYSEVVKQIDISNIHSDFQLCEISFCEIQLNETFNIYFYFYNNRTKQ